MLDDKPLEEFNDQICMATEHFQEHIQPTLLATLRKLKAQKKSARKGNFNKLNSKCKGKS